MYFDIETHTTRRDAETGKGWCLPNASFGDSDTVFLISSVFYWSDSSDVNEKPINVVSIFNTYGVFTRDDVIAAIGSDASNVLSDEQKNRVSSAIYTNSEKDLLIEFGNLVHRMKPDIITGYNSSVYDLPFIVSKMEYYDIYTRFYNQLTADVENKRITSSTATMKGTYYSYSIKLGAGSNADGFRINADGVLFIDTMQLMRRNYPMEEKYSLNYFLALLVLGQKSDMPIPRLMSIIDNIRAYIPYTSTNKIEVEDDSNIDDSERLRRNVEKLKTRGTTAKIDNASNVMTLDSINALTSSNSQPSISTSDVQHTTQSYGGVAAVKSVLLDIADLIVYCETDSALCYKLWAKENIIVRARGKSELAFVDLKNIMFNADSNRVVNMVIANSPHLVFDFTKKTRDANVDANEKYEGAYVVDPTVRGLYIDAPVEEEDVVSLYPSIICAFNLSCEKISRDEAYINKLMAERKIETTPLSISAFGKTDVGWSIFHHNDNAKKGTYVIILEYLMSRRKVLKKEMGKFEKLVKQADKLKSDIAKASLEGRTMTLSADEQKLLDDYPENYYRWIVADGIQLALKIFMNTFYGAAGDQNSPFCEMLVAASITKFGQNLIKDAQSRAKSLGYRIIYGDTDSMYVAAPLAIFEDIKAQYRAGQMTMVELWTEMCKRSKIAGDQLRDDVNQIFEEMTRTPCIKFNHDTTGFPSFWCCKKKYLYLKQGDVPDFTPVEYNDDQYKVKGLPIIARGQNTLLMMLGMEIINGVLRLHTSTEYRDRVYSFINNKITIYDAKSEFGMQSIDICYTHCPKDIDVYVSPKTLNINQVYAKYMTPEQAEKDKKTKPNPADRIIVDDVTMYVVDKAIENIITRKWTIDELKQTAVYKSGKKNQKLVRFCERMKERKLPVPISGERFEFIIVRPKRLTRINGTLIKYNIGDLMEYPDVVEANDMQPFIQKYLSGSVKGMIARFLSYLFYDRRHDNSLVNITEDKKINKDADDICMRYAKRMTDALIEYYSQYKSKQQQDKKIAYTLYKTKVANIKDILVVKYGGNPGKTINDMYKFKKILEKPPVAQDDYEESDMEKDIESYMYNHIDDSSDPKETDDSDESDAEIIDIDEYVAYDETDEGEQSGTISKSLGKPVINRSDMLKLAEGLHCVCLNASNKALLERQKQTISVSISDSDIKKHNKSIDDALYKYALDFVKIRDEFLNMIPNIPDYTTLLTDFIENDDEDDKYTRDHFTDDEIELIIERYTFIHGAREIVDRLDRVLQAITMLKRFRSYLQHVKTMRST
jgi:DNA polymerase elongation subunit (family B)